LQAIKPGEAPEERPGDWFPALDDARVSEDKRRIKPLSVVDLVDAAKLDTNDRNFIVSLFQIPPEKRGGRLWERRWDIVSIALGNQWFIPALVAVADQTPEGSALEEFACEVLNVIEKYMCEENLEQARAGWVHYSRKDELSERYRKWFRVLFGDTVEGFFSFPSGRAVRMASDEEWEDTHDFVQVLFPGLEKSSSGYNTDLVLEGKTQAIVQNIAEFCPAIAYNFYLNIMYNGLRLIRFFGFKLTFVLINGNFFVALEDNRDSPLHRNNNHNCKRLTRLILALRMFGCYSLVEMLKDLLFGKEESCVSSFRDHDSLEYWRQAISDNVPSLM
jgi:hypothetical protein